MNFPKKQRLAVNSGIFPRKIEFSFPTKVVCNTLYNKLTN